MSASVSTRNRPIEASTARQRRGALAFGFVTLLVVGAISTAVTWAAVEIATAAANFATAESYWAKGQADAVLGLYAYATTGEAPELRRAREALAVPLAYRAARQALEGSPAGLETARTELVAAGTHPADATRMIRFYRLLGDAPIVEPALAAWRRSDPFLSRLQGIASDLEAAWAGPDPEPRVTELRRELAVANATLRPIERTFARTLADVVRDVRTALMWGTALSFLLMAMVAGGFVAWAYRRVQRGERNVRAAYEQSAVPMAQLDATGTFLDVNPAFARLLGTAREALRGTPAQAVLVDDDPVELAPGGPTERRVARPDGQELWGRMTVSRIELGGAAGHNLLVMVEDVSEARRLNAELDFRARHDALTGLINRYEIERRLAAALAASARHGDRHTLCFLDLDQFKIVNDTLGHEAGDHLLRAVASLLEDSVRANDVVGRLGGDEFAILLDRAGLDEARGVVETLRSRLEGFSFEWDGRRFDVTGSIGYVEVTDPEEGPGAWLRRADIACYLAKESGRNRAHAYVEGDEALVERQDQMAWVGRLRRALAEERLVLHAQRIVPTRRDGGVCYEVLLRVRDEEGREHPPAAFLPAAERYGIAVELDRRVVRRVLAALEAHPAHVAALDRCHVNLSAHAVSDVEFRDFLVAELDGSPVPAAKLCFEITETAAIRSLPDALQLIGALRERGCLVALDDFGSGLTSFGHLKSLPMDLVKIDGAFVRDMVGSGLDRTIVRAVHDVAGQLGRETVAEYVETDEIRALLEGIGVDYVQGVAIHAPEPWEALLGEG